jgi:hypothetical protein
MNMNPVLKELQIARDRAQTRINRLASAIQTISNLSVTNSRSQGTM